MLFKGIAHNYIWIRCESAGLNVNVFLKNIFLFDQYH